MKRAERERLIERYLSGEMTASEEQNFFIEVAADREMRTELKAYQIVESAVRKDREADTTSYADLRSHMFGVLQASSQTGAHAREAASQAGSGHAAGKFLFAASFGFLSVKMLLSVGAVAVIATGAILLGPWSSDAPKHPAAVPATVRITDTMASPVRIDDRMEQHSPALEQPAEQLPVVQPDAGTARPFHQSEAVKDRKPRPVRDAGPSQGSSNSASGPAAEAATTAIQPVVPQASVPRTLPRDTSAKKTKIRVEITPPRNENR